MKAKFSGGHRDGETFHVAEAHRELRIPYLPERAVVPYERIERGEDGYVKAVPFKIESYLLDHTLDDGTLVYGCVGTIE